jgi:hypothetical protein
LEPITTFSSCIQAEIAIAKNKIATNIFFIINPNRFVQKIFYKVFCESSTPQSDDDK